jgi:hypothetical protein
MRDRHLQWTDSNGNREFERVHMDKVVGLASQLKQTALSPRTYFGLKFGPEMGRFGQRARSTERPSCPPRDQVEAAPRHSLTPSPSFALPLAPLLLSARWRR